MKKEFYKKKKKQHALCKYEMERKALKFKIKYKTKYIKFKKRKEKKNQKLFLKNFHRKRYTQKTWLWFRS